MYVCVCLKIFQIWSFTLSLTSPPKKRMSCCSRSLEVERGRIYEWLYYPLVI